MSNSISMSRAPGESPAQRTLADTRLTAIGLMCSAITLFAFLDTSAKYLATVVHVPVMQIIWMRFVSHAVLTFVVLGPGATMRAAPSRKLGHQLLRSVLLIGSTGFNFLALQYLQLDQTATIFFLSPFIVAALAGPMLDEWVGWRRLLAICVGFSGVLFVTRPGFGGIHWAVSFSFLSTLSYALYSLWTRYLARFDTARTTLVYTPIAGAVLLAPLGIMAWQTPQSAWVWLLLLSTGLSGGFGHWLLILAHERAPAPILAPFGYVNIVFMISLGYLVFSDVPSWWTLAGTAIIIASGIYLLFRERQTAGSSAPASSATVAEG
jgi:drug/metabolite transporter (DMT)-like permease